MEIHTQRLFSRNRIYTRQENIVEDLLSRFPIVGNQETAPNPTYEEEIVSKINDIEELPKGIFLMNLKFINQHKRKDPSLMDKYKKIYTQPVLFVE